MRSIPKGVKMEIGHMIHKGRFHISETKQHQMYGDFFLFRFKAQNTQICVLFPVSCKMKCVLFCDFGPKSQT